MDYEILNIQTVEIFLEEGSEGQEITTVEVGFAWDNMRTFGRIEIKGRPSDDEVLAAVKKRGNEILSRDQAPVGRSLPKRGKI